MFNYLVDILLCDDPHKIRKCAGVEIKPINEINLGINAKDTTKELLTKLKDLDLFTVTNLVKFLKKMVEKQSKEKINKDIREQMTLSEKHHLEYRSLIKVVICPEKCPCCGRICGLEDEHLHHKCIYGHQMRGFNGSYY